MSLRTILIAPHPVLKRQAEPVSAIDGELLALMDDMLETMYAAPGVGLAAPQVGVEKRAVVIDVGGKETPDPIFLINPEIIAFGSETEVAEEGCLSLPDQFADIERAQQVRVRYTDREGTSHEIHAEGLLARCLQHEIDHLDGILFVDHLSALRRSMILRRLKKSQRTKRSA
ncbi:MAG: peptide deformylase [Geminicoccaceae bacterium]